MLNIMLMIIPRPQKYRLMRSCFHTSGANFSLAKTLCPWQPSGSEESMSCHGISIVTNSSRKTLIRKLENELGESIHICPDDNGKLLVCTNSLSKSDLVKRTHALQVELDAIRAQSVAVLLLRNEIKQN